MDSPNVDVGVRFAHRASTQRTAGDTRLWLTAKLAVVPGIEAPPSRGSAGSRTPLPSSRYRERFTASVELPRRGRVNVWGEGTPPIGGKKTRSIVAVGATTTAGAMGCCPPVSGGRR